MSEASPDTVLREIQARVHRFNWFKAYAFVVGGIGVLLLASPPAALAWLLIAAVPGYFLRAWSRERRTARLIYDVDDQELVYRLSVCNAAGEALSKPMRLWHIYSSLATSDWKRNAGASALIRRTRTACRPGSLPGIELNIEPWSIAVGPQQLLFLPDRILVHEQNRFAALPYESLTARHEITRFIEEDPVPPDARQVDTTWRFVNKSGGPDRRFNNNRQLPVMEYGRLTLTSSHGLTVIIESSNPSGILQAQRALEHLREVALQPQRDGAPSAAAETAVRSPGSRTVPAPSAATETAVQSPGSRTVPAAQGGRECLRSLAIVLRYIAAADRKLSDAELDFISKALAGLGTSSTDAEVVMASFSTMRSDDAEAERALLSLVHDAPSIADAIPALADKLAAVDGRVTPKERERLARVAAWMNAGLRNTA